MRFLALSDVPAAALDACLTDVARRDPFVAPVRLPEVLACQGLAAVDATETVLGVGWLRPGALPLRAIEVRVRPSARRQGVGSALLERVGEAAPLLVYCDSAHPRAGRFLTRRGFGPVAVTLHQRWDGAPEDVAPAFRTASLEAGAALELADAVLLAAGVPRAAADEPPEHRVIAHLGGQPVAALVAGREADAWRVLGLAVRPADRGRGVGRLLLTDLMRRAADDESGVVLRVDSEDTRLRTWTQTLGFWTYRSWACYRRSAK